MTEPGETYNYSLFDHINAINSHAGGNIIDYCIYDTTEIIPEYIRNYNMKGYEIVEQDIQKVKNLGIKLMQRNISSTENGYIRHDPELVAQSIIELVCNDLKFNNKQNDTKYMLLNDRLKSSKKHNKKIEKNRSKVARKREKNKSKFFTKYQDRIDSIQESDIKLKEREKINNLQDKLRKKSDKAETNIVSKKVSVRNKKKEIKIPNAIESLDEEDRKKILETINKLRK